MKLKDLQFDFPEELIAIEPAEVSRIMWVGAPDKGSVSSAGAQKDSRAGAGRSSTLNEPFSPVEISKAQLLSRFRPGDVLIVNDTRVVPRRLMVRDDFDVLFLKPLGGRRWQALFQLRKLSGGGFEMPGGVRAQLIEKGRPHIIELNQEIDDVYFESYGEPPLPPYIYRARGELKARAQDLEWYQTDWASNNGSVAAPTASFHFAHNDLERLKQVGATVATVTLHVGAGTFLPVTVDDLNEHVMHKEWVSIPSRTWNLITETRKRGGRVWVLGTTAARALESAAHGRLAPTTGTAASKTGVPASEGEGVPAFEGETDLLIQDDFDFKIVDVLMTNFHQPQSTLLALVCGFAGRSLVFEAYRWAIEKKFRLFSYGDLSVWERPR